MRSDLLDRAQRLQRYAVQDPTNLALLRDLASTLHAAGEHAQALEVLDRIDALSGEPSSGAALRGQVLLALGRWGDAQALFESARRQQPESAALAFNLAYALWASEKDGARAIELFADAVRLEPDNPRFRYYLALALEASGDANAARQALEKAIEIDPGHFDALAMLGHLALGGGDLSAASAFAGRCVAAQPTRADGWQLKGQVALFQLDAAAAAKSLRQALDLAPDDVDTRVSLAQAALMQGRARHARELLLQAVVQDPSHDGALSMLGWACAAENDAPAAATAFERARTRNPENPDAWAGGACICLANGQKESALQWADRALAIDPTHAIASLVKARIAELDDRVVDARAIVEAVLGSAPGQPLGASFGQTVANAAASPGVKRMQRRFTRQLRGAPAAGTPSNS